MNKNTNQNYYGTSGADTLKIQDLENTYSNKSGFNIYAGNGNDLIESVIGQPGASEVPRHQAYRAPLPTGSGLSCLASDCGGRTGALRSPHRIGRLAFGARSLSPS